MSSTRSRKSSGSAKVPLQAAAYSTSDFVTRTNSAAVLSPHKLDSSSAFSIKLAFQTAVAQALTIFFCYISYQLLIMFSEVTQPLFWALFCSVLLKGPKDRVLEYVQDNLGHQGGFIARLKFVLTKFGIVFGPAFVLAVVHRILIGDFPWVWIVLFVGFIVVGLLVYLAWISQDSYDSFLTTSLLFLVSVGSVVFVLFFLFKAVMETSELVLDLKELVEKKLSDPKVGEFLKSLNITSDNIEEKAGFLRQHAEDWVTEQGYNVTQIKDFVASYEEIEILDTIKENLQHLDFQTVKSFILELDYTALYEFSANFSGIAAGFLANASGILLSIASWILSGVNSVLNFAFFIGALFFFLGENSLLDSLFRLLPIPESNQKHVSKSLQTSVNQIFICTLLLSISHGLVTFAYYSVVGMPFPYSAGFLSGLATVIPLIPEWVAYIPSFAVLYFKKSAYIIPIAIGLFVVRWLGGNIDDLIFSQIPGSNPFVTGLALAFGASTYGVQGLLIGPILITVVKTLFSIFTAYVHLEDRKPPPSSPTPPPAAAAAEVKHQE